MISFPFLSLFAINWTGDEIGELKEDEVLNILQKTEVEAGTNITLQDKNNNTFNIIYSQVVDKVRANIILKLKSDFFNWTGLTVNKLKFIVLEDSIEIFVLPLEFICNGTNVISYMPAGMLFTYTDVLQYNFRITKNNLFIRIQGFFINQTQLCEKILEALKNPTAYIRKRDPEFFLSKLIQLQNDLDKLKRENSMLRWAVITLINDENISEDIVNRVVNLKKQNPLITVSQIRDKLKKQDVKLSKSEIAVIITVYFNEFKD